MSWHSIEAIDRAFLRTKKILFEPFDFWKWVKLGIIVLLLGGTTPSYGNTVRSQGDYDALKKTLSDFRPDMIANNFHLDSGHGLLQLPGNLGLLFFGIAVLALIILLLSYISNVMEFVFVESLVTNEIRFWKYSRKFLGKGFSLFFIRFVLGLLFFGFVGFTVLPFILQALKSPSEPSWQLLLGGIFWFLSFLFVFILLFSGINSFLNLAIPLAIYQKIGILAAFKQVFNNFRQSWKEIAVYWLARVVLGIATAFLFGIVFLLVLLTLGLVYLVVDLALYFLVGIFISDSLLWLALAPALVLEFLFFIVLTVLLNVPFSVFLKYHMLSFLDLWDKKAEIPFFNLVSSNPEISPEP